MEAGRRKDLHMGIYYSLYEWYNPLWLADRKRYAIEHMFPQFKDAVTHLKPSIIFSDGEWDMTSDEWRSPELLAWLFNESPVKDEVVIDDRWGKDTRHKHGGYYTTEYTSGMQQAAHPWEESRGMGYSYGYNRNEKIGDYHTGRELIMMLIDIVSRGGNLLLDIGPTADGQHSADHGEPATEQAFFMMAVIWPSRGRVERRLPPADIDQRVVAGRGPVSRRSLHPGVAVGVAPSGFPPRGARPASACGVLGGVVAAILWLVSCPQRSSITISSRTGDSLKSQASRVASGRLGG